MIRGITNNNHKAKLGRTRTDELNVGGQARICTRFDIPQSLDNYPVGLLLPAKEVG
jgi:hypothetical protein